jgi:hypothetical protein
MEERYTKQRQPEQNEFNGDYLPGSNAIPSHRRIPSRRAAECP